MTYKEKLKIARRQIKKLREKVRLIRQHRDELLIMHRNAVLDCTNIKNKFMRSTLIRHEYSPIDGLHYFRDGLTTYKCIEVEQ